MAVAAAVVRKSKAFQIQVELQIQSVNCPGVWLCPNGKLSLQISMLDSCIRTSTYYEPTFPLIIDEKFVFFKSFFGANKLSALQKRLNKEYLYIELIQWKQNCTGNVLACFQSSVADLLYPGNPSIDYCDVDLLMEPMKHFPGILAPKIEVCTKTVIEDKFMYDNTTKQSKTNKETAFVLHPLVSTTTAVNKRKHRRVCHSAVNYKRRHDTAAQCHCNVSEIDTRPPFVCRKVDEALISRKLDFQASASTSNVTNNKLTRKCTKRDSCAGCTEDYCAVCAKYKHYFDNEAAVSVKSMKCPKINEPTQPPRCCMGNEQEEPNYIESRSPTLAETIHRRLQATLDACPPINEYISTNARDCYNDCDCSTTAANFCKKLYNKSKMSCH